MRLAFRFGLHLVILACAAFSIWGVTALLSSRSYHDRMLWGGGVAALVINAGLAFKEAILKKED